MNARQKDEEVLSWGDQYCRTETPFRPMHSRGQTAGATAPHSAADRRWQVPRRPAVEGLGNLLTTMGFLLRRGRMCSQPREITQPHTLPSTASAGALPIQFLSFPPRDKCSMRGCGPAKPCPAGAALLGTGEKGGQACGFWRGARTCALGRTYGAEPSWAFFV